MNKSLKTAEALAKAKLIAPSRVATLSAVVGRYAVSITPAVAALMRPGDPDDPIARQFLPDEAEMTRSPEERADPIGDAAHSPVRGVVHRHSDRVLLKLVQACPVYCRFCFRREMVGPHGEAVLSVRDLDAIFAYLAHHVEIREAIVTGGDPFVLGARRIRDLTRRLSGIGHIRVLRWHTRIPVVEPEKITSNFAEAIKLRGRATYVALHANHPRELTPQARAASACLVDAGIPMLSQTVLLKGVNDDIETLVELMQAFVETRIKPYYLHHADLAPGTSHFRVPLARGQELVRELRARASGLCQPEYVIDIPGGFAKARVALPDFEIAGNTVALRDHAGRLHTYPQAAG